MTRHSYGYVRVSTDKQADVGLSLEAQTEKVRAMAIVAGVELADVLVDAGESAKSLDRPRITWLLDQVDSDAVGMVIVAKLDRLTRNVVDLHHLLRRFERHRVDLISVAEDFNTSTAMGRFALNMMILVSQWEREVIAERTRDVMRYMKANGECVGTPAFGSRRAANPDYLEADPREQELLTQIRALKASGCSTRKIAAALNAGGATTRRGTSWRFQYVARVMRISDCPTDLRTRSLDDIVGKKRMARVENSACARPRMNVKAGS